MAIKTPDCRKLSKNLLEITLKIKTKFYDLRISHKLNLGFGVLVGLTFLVGVRNYLGSHEIATDELHNNAILAGRADDL